MSEPASPESIGAIRKLFFGKLAQTSRDLMNATADLSLQINDGNCDAILVLLGDMENRIQAMRNIMTVFDECLEG